MYEPRVLIRRVERRVPAPPTVVAHALASVVLVPVYALAAAAIRTPGMRFHLEAIDVAVRLLVRHGRRMLWPAGRLALYPLDSTRYFEFDWMWSRLMRLGSVSSYLDVSSPRFLPLCFARRARVGHAWLLNPDAGDLGVTRQWAEALSLSTKCDFIPASVESSDLHEGAFEVITSMSVFEHVADDRRALARVHRVLSPGGTLLLTLPCAAAGYDQYRDYDEYNLSQPDADGRYFFQRFYDEPSLRERIFSVLGEPRQMTVYGEREAGYFGRNVQQKMRGLPYPFWREPFMMGRHFQVYPAIASLPGEGVVAMEFVK